MIFKLFFIILFNCCHAQNTSFEIIKAKLQNADSIILISHILTEEYLKPIYDWDTRYPSKTSKKNKNELPVSHKFIEKGRINSAIITESKLVLNDKDLLIEILTKSPIFENYNKISCDMPQHSIIIYKNGRQSYFDICFRCKKIHTSKDFNFSEIDFDNEKWERLEVFFKKLGVKQFFFFPKEP
jgi:hypothetical protein